MPAPSQHDPGGGSSAAGPARLALRFADGVEGVCRLGAYLGIGALTIAILIVVVDVVWRRIGDQALIGAVDLTQLCVMAAAFLSIPYAFARRAHVVVDLLASRLPPGGRRALDALGAAASVALLALVLHLGWGRAMEQFRYGDVSQDLAIPMIWYWGFVLVGMALSVLAALGQFLRRLAAGGEGGTSA